jgi:hypothetical protein
VEGGREEASSTKGNAVPSAPLDFGQEAVGAKLSDQATDASATAMGFFGVGRWGAPELALKVVVGESVDEMGAGDDGLEEVGVCARDGVETGEVLTVLDTRTAEGVELCDGGRGGLDLGKGIEIAAVDGLTDLDVAPEVVDALTHAHPAATATSTPIVFEAKDPEVGRVVDHGFDPQDAPLVVELEPVLANAVLDTAPLGTSG